MRPARSVLTGPLPALPAPLDAASRAWSGAGGRVRGLVRLLAAAVVAALLVGRLAHGPFGPPTSVLVVTRPLAAGAPLTADDVAVRTRPADVVPDGAVRSLEALGPDATAAGPLPRGAVVSAAQVTAGGPGALATPGSAVVAVDAAALPPLPVGTRLDVAGPAVDGTMRVAAADAVVVGDDGTWRWLRVDRADVAALADGIRDGRLVPAVLPAAPDAAP